MDGEDHDTTTRLMTLLNVSQLRSSKRKLARSAPTASSETPEPAEKKVKLNKKRVVVVKTSTKAPNDDLNEGETAGLDASAQEEEDILHDDDKDQKDDVLDPHVLHFGPNSSHLTTGLREAAQAGSWKKTTKKGPAALGPSSIDHVPETNDTVVQGATDINAVLVPRLLTAYTKQQKLLSPALRAVQNSVLQHLITSADLCISKVRLHEHAAIREATALYALNHILKIRRTVLKNNDRISSALAKTPPLPPPEDVQDQGFTRPSVLILAPFRNSALSILQNFLDAYTNSSSSSSASDSQIHNYARFTSQFSLPEGSVDKLSEAVPGTYPVDHIATFAGNIDDNFRVGVKVTRRSVRLFEGFYGSDLVLASPLGLRVACEKEGNSDFLSSIELVIVDQMDAMTMQNWDHVQYVFSQLNKLPKESHGADFSRIKPWYLDGHAANLRQTVLLSSYETPETRALFNGLKNVAGKTRTVGAWESVQVPEGVVQNYIKFESSNIKDEPDKRFEHFTNKLFPATLKSAVQSSGTLIFVPSYFDFVRVQNWLIKKGTSCVFISEYSTNQDISRARQAFFNGTKSFIVITERFYFFRRYKLRGVQNVIFYAPPEHAQFYGELLAFPFLDDGIEASDVTVKVLYSKYDAMRLERLVGSRAVGGLIVD